MQTKTMTPSEWSSIRELEADTKYLLAPGRYKSRIFRQASHVEIVGEGEVILEAPVQIIVNDWTFSNVTFQYTNPDSREVLVDLFNGASYIVFHDCLFQHAGVGTGVRHDGLRSTGGSQLVTVDRCTFKNCARTWILAYGARNWSITNSLFDGCGSGNSSVHAGGIVFNDCSPNSGISIKNNTLMDATVTEMVELKDSIQGGFTVTNNLFLQRPGFIGSGCSNGVIGTTHGDTLSNSNIKFNCFYGIKKGQSGFYIYEGTGNDLEGNVWVDCIPPRLYLHNSTAEWPEGAMTYHSDLLFPELPRNPSHFHSMIVDALSGEIGSIEEKIVKEHPSEQVYRPLLAGVSYPYHFDPNIPGNVILGEKG